MTNDPSQSRVMTWIGRALWAVFVVFMLMDVTMKLLRLPVVEQTGQGLGLPAGSGFGIGVMEAIILALYIYPRTAVLGAILVAALMGGTAATNFIAGKPLFGFVLFGVYLALFAWGGLWLRDARLRALIPLRRP
jgi:hypothetical protein